MPFGGYKMSGYGRESGVQHLEEYLNVKAVWTKTASSDRAAGRLAGPARETLPGEPEAVPCRG